MAGACAANAGTRHTAADSAWGRLLALRMVLIEFDLLSALELVIAVVSGERGQE